MRSRSVDVTRELLESCESSMLMTPFCWKSISLAWACSESPVHVDQCVPEAVRVGPQPDGRRISRVQWIQTLRLRPADGAARPAASFVDVAQALLERGDFAEPLHAAGLVKPFVGVGLDLQQARHLGKIQSKDRAPYVPNGTKVRDMARLDVARVGKVEETGDRLMPFRLLDSRGVEALAVTEFLHRMLADDASPAWMFRGIWLDALRPVIALWLKITRSHRGS
jgi:hypothetical protein